MARGSGLTAELWLSEIPVLPYAREMIAAGRVPGATKRNLDHYGPDAEWDPTLTPDDRKLLADPQTSGGLLLACPDDKLGALLADLTARGARAAAVIGRMHARGDHTLVLRASR
jgi:selenide,water dikinase